MKVLVILLLTGLNSLPLHELRNRYESAARNKEQCRELLQDLEAGSTSPLLQGYAACAKILLARHSVNPLNKLRYFEQGRNDLEHAISKDKQSVELRYLRYTVQTNIPDFLGYSENIVEDKKILIASLQSVTDPDLQKRIRNYLISSGDLPLR